MSTEEVQETEEINPLDILREGGQLSEPLHSDESEETTEEATEKKEASTNDSFRASLDEIEDPDTLKQMVKKLRQENAKHRTEKNSTKEELEEFRKWKESQLTEVERAQLRAKEIEDQKKDVERQLVKVKFGFDEIEDEALSDVIDTVLNGSLEEMMKKAEALSKHIFKAEESSAPVATTSFSRQPVKTNNKPVGGAFLEFIAQRDLGG